MVTGAPPFRSGVAVDAQADNVAVDECRATLADWRTEYNVDRPHSSIGWQTPNEYAATFAPQRGLTLRPLTSSAPAPIAQTAQLGKTEHRSLAQVG